MKKNDKIDSVKKREIFGWAMYDFANSAYTTIVITVVYSAFFAEKIVGENYAGLKNSLWSISMIGSTILVIFISPLLGYFNDNIGYKKRSLLICTILCSSFTALLFYVGVGQAWKGVLFVLISNTFFMLSENVCSSFLKELSNKSNVSLISGIGWGIGYLGGLGSLILVLWVSEEGGVLGERGYVERNQYSMLATGMFYFLASLPTFLLLKERNTKTEFNLSKKSFEKIGAYFNEVYRILKFNPQLQRFFIAFTIFMAGIEIIIKFVGIYSTQVLKLSIGELTMIFLALQISAATGSIGLGIFEKKIGLKNSLYISIVLWIISVLLIYFIFDFSKLFGIDVKKLFFIICIFAGLGLGSIQSTSRSIVAILSSKENNSLMFGYWGTFSKLAIILGMSYGFLADYIDSQQNALLLIILFLALGIFQLKKIKI